MMDKQVAHYAEILEKFTVIDTSDALNRLGGNIDLFADLLTDFVTEYSDSFDKYKKLIKQDDKESARRLIHTIKGVSGNLGAKTLHQSASKLEAAIKEEDFTRAEQLSQAFSIDLNLMLYTITESGITKLHSEPQQTDNTAELAELQYMLEEYISHASNRKAKPAKEILEKIIYRNGSAEYQSSIDKIHVLSKKYKFKEAVKEAMLLSEKIKDKIFS